jgi:hypothetical protein
MNVRFVRPSLQTSYNGAEIDFTRETRGGNLRGISSPKSRGVRRAGISATSLLAPLRSSPSFKLRARQSNRRISRPQCLSDLDMALRLRKRKLEDVRRNRSNGENIMSHGGGDFHRAFDMLLTLDLAEIEVLIPKFRLGPIVGRTHRLQRKFRKCVCRPYTQVRGAYSR